MSIRTINISDSYQTFSFNLDNGSIMGNASFVCIDNKMIQENHSPTMLVLNQFSSWEETLEFAIFLVQKAVFNFTETCNRVEIKHCTFLSLFKCDWKSF